MTDAAFDKVVRGGTVVTPEGRVVADVGIRGETIAQIGGAMRGVEEIDARGLLVLPGGVDPHVHMVGQQEREATTEPSWVDDFTSASAAALAGGLTTIGQMTFPMGTETPAAAVAREQAEVARAAIADVFLHPVLGIPSAKALDDLPTLFSEGHLSLKVYMVLPPFDACQAAYVAAMAMANEAGAITLFHCEDATILQCCAAALEAGGQGGLEHFAESRPVVGEVVAVQRAIALAELTGAPIYIVHLSSERALRVCMEARGRGLPVYVETRPLYLHFTRERFAGPDGPLYMGAPPLREAADVAALWSGLSRGFIDVIGSDHAPWLRADKLDPRQSLTEARQGIAELDTMLPRLFSEGVGKGRFDLARFVELTSSNAARLFGLYPKKGAIAVGSDADLVVWNPEETRAIQAATQRSRADYSVYEGMSVKGWPVVTMRRGEVVYRDGQVLGRPGTGKLLARGPSQPLRVGPARA